LRRVKVRRCFSKALVALYHLPPPRLSERDSVQSKLSDCTNTRVLRAVHQFRLRRLGVIILGLGNRGFRDVLPNRLEIPTLV
jgi:hypothetical protein